MLNFYLGFVIGVLIEFIGIIYAIYKVSKM